MGEIGVPVALVSFAASVLALSGTFFALLRSAPAQLLDASNDAHEIAARALKEVEDVRAERIRFQREVEGLLESVENETERVEHKRKQVAARLSRAGKDEPAQVDPLRLPRDEQISYYRQRQAQNGG